MPYLMVHHIHLLILLSFYYGTYTSIQDRRQHKMLKKAFKNAALIIAASQYIKDDLLQSGFDGTKIIVVHNGIDHKIFFPLADVDAEYVDIKPFAIKRPYFIYSSRLSGSDKKHLQLIKAFELFKKRTNYISKKCCKISRELYQTHGIFKRRFN